MVWNDTISYHTIHCLNETPAAKVQLRPLDEALARAETASKRPEEYYNDLAAHLVG
jgi:hypothetical protein